MRNIHWEYTVKIYAVSRVIDEHKAFIVRCFLNKADAHAYLIHINNHEYNDLRVVEHDLIEDSGGLSTWYGQSVFFQESTNYETLMTTRKVVYNKPTTHRYYYFEGPQTDPCVQEFSRSVVVNSRDADTVQKVLSNIISDKWPDGV